MKCYWLFLVVSLTCMGCGGSDSVDATPSEEITSVTQDSVSSFRDARSGFTTELVKRVSLDVPADEPPEGILELVSYPGPLGDMAAYVSPDPSDGQKHRAVIWLTGGFSNSIGATAWLPADPSNDQSASQYREAGLVMMYPALRGGNNNPGHTETLYGEVDDVIAATKWFKALPYVDPDRVYLGGHSTGGTLALLVAACSADYRGVVSFGPVGDVRGYGPESLAFDFSDDQEAMMRAPIQWLHCIQSPTYIFEGSDGNAESLAELHQASENPMVVAKSVDGYDHFSVLAPINAMVARQMMADDGERFELKLGSH